MHNVRARENICAADIFIGPSRTATDGCVEAQGLTFIGAMVAGTPVVASRSGGIVDSVSHGVTGLLVSENSPTEIADAILRLHGDKELARSLCEAAKRVVDAEFSREVSAGRFARLFEDFV